MSLLIAFLYHYDWSVIPKSARLLAGGLQATLEISALALVLSLSLGLVVALGRLAPFRPLSLTAFAYVQVFRALSLYVYILWVYFGIAALTGINFSRFTAGVISLTLLNSAYMAEIYRSAIRAIDPGQWEAAISMGMNRVATFATVVLPQAWRIAVPSLVNQLVDIIKDSSIVAVIGTSDLMFRTIDRVSFYNRPFEFYTTTGLIYLTIVLIVAYFATLLERRLRLPV